MQSEPCNAASPLLIKVKAASLVLGISPRKLWSLTNCNAIPSRRIGRAVMYSPIELQAWIACDCPTEAGAATRVRKSVAV